MLSASEGWRREYDLGDNELKMSWGFILDVTRMMCVVVNVVCRVGLI